MQNTITMTLTSYEEILVETTEGIEVWYMIF